MDFYWMSVMDSVEISKQILCVLMTLLAANTRSHQEAGLFVCVYYPFPVKARISEVRLLEIFEWMKAECMGVG